MKKLFFITSYYLLHTACSFAQHCPWDCAGMIIVDTNVPREKIAALRPFLVDEKGKGIARDTYDECELMYYDDFTEKRKSKVLEHPYYRYDTAYTFAQGKFIVKYNYCEHKGKLYLSFINPYRRDLHYEMIEVAENKRIHLHDYNEQLRERGFPGMDALLQPFILRLDCSAWHLNEYDCE
jgi:hypothetical protein